MDPQAVRSIVRGTVGEMVGHHVEDSELIVSSGLLDSLSVVQLIAELEQKLNVTIPPANLQPEDFDNVDLIIETLERTAR
jgi:acyl carrier protein